MLSDEELEGTIKGQDVKLKVSSVIAQYYPSRAVEGVR
jgi:hypothetical protein